MPPHRSYAKLCKIELRLAYPIDSLVLNPLSKRSWMSVRALRPTIFLAPLALTTRLDLVTTYRQASASEQKIDFGFV